MQIRFGRVKVSGFRIDAFVKWEREREMRHEKCFFLKTWWCMQVQIAVDRRQVEPGPSINNRMGKKGSGDGGFAGQIGQSVQACRELRAGSSCYHHKGSLP